MPPRIFCRSHIAVLSSQGKNRKPGIILCLRITVYYICICIYSIDWPTSRFWPVNLPLDIYIGHYRWIYLLNKTCNVTFGKLYIPFMKLFLILTFILCFFATVRVLEYLDLFILVFVLIVVLTSLLLLVPISIIMSSFFDISRVFSKNFSARINNDTKETAIVKSMVVAQLRSCQVIRCEVGNVYYMEAQAKLTMLQHVVNGVVFLMVNVDAWINSFS